MVGSALGRVFELGHRIRDAVAQPLADRVDAGLGVGCFRLAFVVGLTALGLLVASAFHGVLGGRFTSPDVGYAVVDLIGFTFCLVFTGPMVTLPTGVTFAPVMRLVTPAIVMMTFCAIVLSAGDAAYVIATSTGWAGTAWDLTMPAGLTLALCSLLLKTCLWKRLPRVRRHTVVRAVTDA